VVVPDELAADLDHLDLHVVEVAHDAWRPRLVEVPELVGEVDDVHEASVA
jgi:hypothetical protein